MTRTRNNLHPPITRREQPKMRSVIVKSESVTTQVASVESVMFSRGIRASQLLEKMEHKNDEPWLTDMPAPDPLTRLQEIALLTLRKSDHCEQVLKALRAQGASWATRSDYEALVRLHLATRNVRGYHSITPHGHWRAGKLAHAIAVELGIKLVDYRRAMRSGPQRLYGMSDSGNG